MEALLPQITRQPSRKIAMLFSGTCKRATSPDGATPQSERVDSSDTPLGNRAHISKPIEITNRGTACIEVSGGGAALPCDFN